MSESSTTEKKNVNEHWRALESNPDVLGSFINKVGVPKPWTVTDVFGLDPELLAFVPQPCIALIIIFPSKGYPRVVVPEDQQMNDAFYLKQVDGLPNACGSIAAIHAVANNKDTLELPEDSILGKFLAETKDKSPQEIGEFLVHYKPILDVHNSLVEKGQTQAKGNDEKVGAHFACLTEIDGYVVELDGAYKNHVMRHAKVGDDGFLAAAAKVFKEKFLNTSESLNFAITALCKAAED